MTAASTTRRSTPTAAEAPPVLRLTEISRSFGPVTALKGISLEIRRGEVIGLVDDLGERVEHDITPGTTYPADAKAGRGPRL